MVVTRVSFDWNRIEQCKSFYLNRVGRYESFYLNCNRRYESSNLNRIERNKLIVEIARYSLHIYYLLSGQQVRSQNAVG